MVSQEDLDKIRREAEHIFKMNQIFSSSIPHGIDPHVRGFLDLKFPNWEAEARKYLGQKRADFIEEYVKTETAKLEEREAYRHRAMSKAEAILFMSIQLIVNGVERNWTDKGVGPEGKDMTYLQIFRERFPRWDLLKYDDPLKDEESFRQALINSLPSLDVPIFSFWTSFRKTLGGVAGEDHVEYKYRFRAK